MRYIINFLLTEDKSYEYYTSDKEYAIFLCHCINKFYPDYFGLSVWDNFEEQYIYYVDELSKKEGNKNEYI